MFQDKFILSIIPVLNYYIYLTYTLMTNKKTGIIDYIFSYVGIPLTIIISLFIYLITLFFDKNSEIPNYILFTYILISIIIIIYKIKYKSTFIIPKNIIYNIENKKNNLF